MKKTRPPGGPFWSWHGTEPMLYSTRRNRQTGRHCVRVQTAVWPVAVTAERVQRPAHGQCPMEVNDGCLGPAHAESLALFPQHDLAFGLARRADWAGGRGGARQLGRHCPE